MGFGKHFGKDFGKGMKFISIVLDEDGRELARWKVNKKEYSKSVRMIVKQFGLKIKVIDKDDIEKNENKDLDWALK